ncbi:hypothetical protein JHK85_007766 [Glycine max]|uniref:Uncharacterized protein n=1 Tax=Glycine soja TaxID=3848 RepID=A0A445LBT6_GLYSO|nr:uncharacterized protein LOC114405247 [Glycine soja]KAG5055256.1 hypothetical protein JHK85_007766 [Glycine max]KAG5072330.1 hypothetical protein JHK86_007541 [Glycine max]RZC20772.1 hypothetical protein D0Y65_007220 [Glycine soja]|eukprot:XP_006577690.1 uncharacterized protein LOC102662786 [Glycine max]
MGRSRGKGKKLTISNEEDAISEEEEKVPKQKRRGRPHKLYKEDFDEEEIEEILEEDATSGDNVMNVVSSKEMNGCVYLNNLSIQQQNSAVKIQQIAEKWKLQIQQQPLPLVYEDQLHQASNPARK